jgi:adenylate cyclase
MGQFFAELKRRHIYRVGAVYVVAAWILAQAVDLLSQVFELPHSIAQPAILLLAAGLPVTLIIAWIAESKPQEKIARAVRSEHTAVDWALFGVVALLVALTGYREMPQSSALPGRSGIEAAREASASSSTALAIAVLPFTNMSGDAGQEFFSDGITEEITAALAKIPDLRVVARTSAFEFKGKNVNTKTMGEQLGVTHLIEGSVRKAGERLRITAQLIKADDGTHVWAENYDRDLTDVFAIQESIARAIATSLRMPLGLPPGESLVTATNNLGTYQEFLQAKAWVRYRGSPQSGPYLQTLESIVNRDPGFGPAWAQLSRAYNLQITDSDTVAVAPVEEALRVVQSLRVKAESAAQKAIQLDRRHPAGYWAMASLNNQSGQWESAEEFTKQGLDIDPNDPDLLNSSSGILLRTGNPSKALVVVDKLRTLEPLIPIYTATAALTMLSAKQSEAAITLLEGIPPNARGGLAWVYLSRAYAEAGRYGEAADTMQQFATINKDQRRAKALRDALAMLRNAPTTANDQNALPKFGGNLAGELIFAYTAVGAFDRILDYAEREVKVQFMSDWGKSMWGPLMSPVRKTERFKKLVRDAGLVEYWRARGWPEFCRPTVGDDFVCE